MTFSYVFTKYVTNKAHIFTLKNDPQSKFLFVFTFIKSDNNSNIKMAEDLTKIINLSDGLTSPPSIKDYRDRVTATAVALFFAYVVTLSLNIRLILSLKAM